MVRSTKEQPEDTGKAELELEDQELASVDISDDELETVDKQKELAKKKARKVAKTQRTPKELKKAKRKKQLIIAVALVGALITLGVVPFTRWTILNLMGFRSTVVVHVQDGANQQPLSNVTLKVDSKLYGVTDPEGKARFENIKLGRHSITADKIGYSHADEVITAEAGMTSDSALTLKVIGIKLDLDVKDWLSGQVISSATVKSGENASQTDKNGRASIVVPPNDTNRVELEVSAPGYLTKTVNTGLSVESREVTLVAAQKDYFISKRDGKLDIFSSNLDGTNQQKIIEATGKEDEQLLQFTINRTNKQAVLVATREGKKVNERIVAGIYLIDLENSSLRKVDEGSNVQLIDWGNDALIYSKSMPEANYDDPGFMQVISLNPTSGKVSQLTQANYFPAIAVAQNKLYYMPADAYRPIENASLTSIDLANSARRTYLPDKQVSLVSRTNYGNVQLSLNDGTYYDLQLNSGTAKPVNRNPGASFSFSLSPNGQNVAWADRRDGQGVLLVRSVNNPEERVVVKSSGFTTPVRWLSDDLIVIRSATSQETADYVVHVPTGKMGKVVDVSNVGQLRPEGI